MSIGFAEVEVQAGGWLDALATGLHDLGVDLAEMGSLAIEPQEDGGAIARDPVTELEITIVPVGSGSTFDMPTPSLDALDSVPADGDPFDLPEPRSLPGRTVGAAASRPPAGLSAALLTEPPHAALPTAGVALPTAGVALPTAGVALPTAGAALPTARAALPAERPRATPPPPDVPFAGASLPAEPGRVAPLASASPPAEPGRVAPPPPSASLPAPSGRVAPPPGAPALREDPPRVGDTPASRIAERLAQRVADARRSAAATGAEVPSPPPTVPPRPAASPVAVVSPVSTASAESAVPPRATAFQRPVASPVLAVSPLPPAAAGAAPVPAVGAPVPAAGEPLPPQAAVTPAPTAPLEAAALRDPAIEEPDATVETGKVVTPTRAARLSDDILEDLFLRLGDISAATGVAAASGIALRILLDLVPAGAGAVLIRTRAGDGLRFRAASGPAAQQLVDTVIPLERGIAGFVCQLGVGLSVGDVRRDRRHDARVDRATGYTTRAMLAVPVRADTGAPYGCVELLNPPRPFTEQDMEIAARVAASLGAFLQSVHAVR